MILRLLRNNKGFKILDPITKMGREDLEMNTFITTKYKTD